MYDSARAHREFLEAEAVASKNVEGTHNGGSSQSSDIALSAGTMAEPVARKRYETRGRRGERQREKSRQKEDDAPVYILIEAALMRHNDMIEDEENMAGSRANRG